ncbi:ricin-type beta-trefoil lectin domain protein [Streptomyces sp. NPDC058371]|uniref:RICIN domain-containing protein n=1 Tax=Streptomyces sp. NPDC058371 TaxID=3346463 RepID=UPI0036469943
MHTPHPPRPSYPPRSAAAPGESDESLAAQLRGRPEGEATRSVALLMARHWQPAYDYSVICLASSAAAASMATAASFHQVLEGLTSGGAGAALRPRLLVTVRDTVRAWAGDDGTAGALPDVRKPAGGRGMRAAKSMTAENRKLSERAFLGLPALAQCLLWHTEVEAEHISVPAGLSGMDTDTASVTLEQAHEQFRAGCVRAHHELAPSQECRYYNRLLDVPIRRGGALLPDVQQHLLECRYCRFAAEQLSHFEGGLGTLLAEAVLGWGARRYLESRPGRAQQGARARGAAHGAARTSAAGAGREGAGGGGGHTETGEGDGRTATGEGSGGRHRLLSHLPTQGRRSRHGQNNHAKVLITGAGLASAAVLATVLTTSLWSDDDGPAGPAASTSATGSRTAASPAPGVSNPPGATSPPGSAGDSTAPQQTRLRNVAADLCLDIRGAEPKSGAGAKLAVCSSAWTQQWSYEEDGLLRSVADPGLCLDSHADASGIAVLGHCVSASAKRADDVRYDLTVRGELLPRWKEELAVAPASKDPNADVVSKNRSGSDDQRWATDAPSAAPDSLSIAGTATPSTQPASDPPPTAGAPEEPDEERTAPSRPDPEPAPSGTHNEPRAVTVDHDTKPAPALPLPLPAPLSDVLTGIGL